MFRDMVPAMIELLMLHGCFEQREGMSEVVIDMLKIDTEGHDLKVIYSAEDALKKHQIKLIVFEFGANWGENGATLEAAVEYLNGMGYDSYMMSQYDCEGYYGCHHIKLDDVYWYVRERYSVGVTPR